MNLFIREPDNPILEPSGVWWESRGVLNPGVVKRNDEFVMIYRAVGADGISRFGRASSPDGVHFRREQHPWAETTSGDWDGRLGIEDPRITQIGGTYYLTYAKVGVEPGNHDKLSWETAPFHIRSWIAKTEDFDGLAEVACVLPPATAKDLVLFPKKVNGRYYALIRQYPSIQLLASQDLVDWDEISVLMAPTTSGWEAERIGSGPPPILTDRGWLVIYHANEYLRLPGNRRMYRLGLALLDSNDPSVLLYRHPEPIFEPEEAYEREGPVGNVVFGTALVDAGGELLLYYGAGDGVIGLARTRKSELLELIPDKL